ncbi:hypothetical protein Aduo_015940 [Ancylostoma duodenale]
MDDIDRELQRAAVSLAIPRVLRDRACPFDTLSDEEFRMRFRLTRRSFFKLCRELDDGLSPECGRNKALTTPQKLGLTLQILAGDNYQITQGDLSGCAQSTISRAFDQTVRLLYRRRWQYVTWPRGERALRVKRRFFELCGIPNIIGAIDGSHIRIVGPSINEHAYVNRKDKYSINGGFVCDHDGRFTWLSVKWPGRAHDSRVFRCSTLYQKLQNGQLHGILLGDSGYRAERFLIKPLLGDHRTNAERRYTKSVCQGRVVIEHAFGRLKRQFSALGKRLNYTPEKASRIIAAAVCLRNVCIDAREPDFQGLDDDEDESSDEESLDQDTDSGTAMINHIVRTYFST